MPTYAYACTNCDNRFEVVQSFSDDSLTVCPECEGRLRKVFNSVGVVFKGSGFYRNDSRSAKNGSGSAATSSTDSSSTSGKETTASASSSSASDSSTSSAPSSPSSSDSSSGAKTSNAKAS